MTSVTAECQEYGVEQGPGQQVEDSRQSREEAVEDDWGQDSQAAFVSVGRTYLPVRQIRARKTRKGKLNMLWTWVAKSPDRFKPRQVWHRIARSNFAPRHVNRLVKRNVTRHTNGAWTPLGKRTVQGGAAGRQARSG